MVLGGQLPGRVARSHVIFFYCIKIYTEFWYLISRIIIKYHIKLNLMWYFAYISFIIQN